MLRKTKDTESDFQNTDAILIDIKCVQNLQCSIITDERTMIGSTCRNVKR